MGNTLLNPARAISEEEANSYFDNTVEATYTNEPLKTTMIQKYFALWGASGEATESYNDLRRMTAPTESFIQLQNTKPIHLRSPNGNSDTTTKTLEKATYEYGQ